MARCAHGGLDAGGGFRLWPLFSAAALRRKLLEVLTCGGGGGGAFESPEPRPRARSDRLVELLRADASECGSDEAEAERRRKAEAVEEMKVVVGGLQRGGEERLEAAAEVRRLAKDDADAREALAMLGAVPPLVAMLDPAGDGEMQVAALYALLNLGVGNDMNKAAIVQAGAVHKMLRTAEASEDAWDSVSEAVIANLLSLSALDANKAVIGASGAIPFLARAFRGGGEGAPAQPRHDALRALYNLSIAAPNAPGLVAAGVVPTLLAAVAGGGVAEADLALAALSNLVAASPDARRALGLSRAPAAYPVLVDALDWADVPACQEKAAYVLMVMAHKSHADRAAMAEAGATSALLELALAGTALAQKRASRILEALRLGKGKQPAERPCNGNASAPLERGGGEEAGGEEAAMSEEKRAVRQLVQQSLQSNMRRIVRRARLPQDLAPPESGSLRALTASTTSKSLPF